MKRSISFVVLLILALLMSFPGSATQAAAVTQAIAPSSITTLTGGVSGAVGRLKLQDQSGTADTPSKYVLFTTQAKIYKGYRQFILPTAIAPASITGMSVKVNYIGLTQDT